MKEVDVSSLEYTSWRCQYNAVFAPKYRRMEIYGKIKGRVGVTSSWVASWWSCYIGAVWPQVVFQSLQSNRACDRRRIPRCLSCDCALPYRYIWACERVRFNQFVPNTELLQGHFKQCWFWVLAVSQMVGELESIICLNTLDRIRELHYNTLEELRRGIGAVLSVRL